MGLPPGLQTSGALLRGSCSHARPRPTWSGSGSALSAQASLPVLNRGLQGDDDITILGSVDIKSVAVRIFLFGEGKMHLRRSATLLATGLLASWGSSPEMLDCPAGRTPELGAGVSDRTDSEALGTPGDPPPLCPQHCQGDEFLDRAHQPGRRHALSAALPGRGGLPAEICAAHPARGPCPELPGTAWGRGGCGKGCGVVRALED